MHKLILLLGAFLCAGLSYSQKTDSLVIFYKTDQYSISKDDKQKLDSFLAKGWDKIEIKGYTDEMDDDAYNMDLSRKRSNEVYQYFRKKNIGENILAAGYFGETLPQGDNNTEEGRALNRRTEIIGYKYPKPVVTIRKPAQPAEDPMKPVTKSLDNGFIITYRPGTLPMDIADNFASGSSENFQVITNTRQMRENSLFNNTTQGEILSSVMIICGNRINPCLLDSPVLMKVPIPETNCPIENVKFFNAVAEKGYQVWKEESKNIVAEEINGRKYVGIWINDFCQCINFDFKIDSDCYEVDSSRLYVDTDIKNMSVELAGMNSVYIPREVDDNTQGILHLKDYPQGAAVSFKFYNGKRRVKSFYNQPLTSFPYDSVNKKYILSRGSYSFTFPDLKIFSLSLRINRDRYWVYPENKGCEVVYLNRATEKILVDFMVLGRKSSLTQYRSLPLESFRIDETTGSFIIDKELIRVLKEKEKMKGAGVAVR
jgi:hypothetical protein